MDAILAPAKRHIWFGTLVVMSAIVFHGTARALIQYSLQDASSSHIILIPLISVFLLYVERKQIFGNTRTNLFCGIGLILGGMILFRIANWSYFPQSGNLPLTFETLSIVLVWLGGFFLCYGAEAVRAAAFPLLFLLLMIPLPASILDRLIYALQEGSTQIAYRIFQAVGTPVLRHGFMLSVPGVTIEVARECSSIRSSMALFITCLLAAHLYLRTWWKIILLLVLGLLLSVVKNGIRIATLTLLSIYVDPSFLSGSLHRDGGFAFFLLALLILWPVFAVLEKSDNARRLMGATN
ncbi:MAG TPA: exosortase/archaeosortase family protein [Candidatus Acidoferrum sp.]|nr:exosortase/archaeosortase family protein [Candidatus Acidoferrum sp.]